MVIKYVKLNQKPKYYRCNKWNKIKLMHQMFDELKHWPNSNWTSWYFGAIMTAMIWAKTLVYHGVKVEILVLKSRLIAVNEGTTQYHHISWQIVIESLFLSKIHWVTDSELSRVSLFGWQWANLHKWKSLQPSQTTYSKQNRHWHASWQKIDLIAT